MPDRAERERRKRLRWAAEREQRGEVMWPLDPKVVAAVQTTPIKGPGDAQFTATLDKNFETIKEVLQGLTDVVREQQERIQDLEAAALGKPLEEIT